MKHSKSTMKQTRQNETKIISGQKKSPRTGEGRSIKITTVKDLQPLPDRAAETIRPAHRKTNRHRAARFSKALKTPCSPWATNWCGKAWAGILPARSGFLPGWAGHLPESPGVLPACAGSWHEASRRGHEIICSSGGNPCLTAVTQAGNPLPYIFLRTFFRQPTSGIFLSFSHENNQDGLQWKKFPRAWMLWYTCSFLCYAHVIFARDFQKCQHRFQHLWNFLMHKP